MVLTGTVIAEVKANAILLDTGLWNFAEAMGIQKRLRFVGAPEQHLELAIGTTRQNRPGR
jgi:hypothetical protein